MLQTNFIRENIYRQIEIIDNNVLYIFFTFAQSIYIFQLHV